MYKPQEVLEIAGYAAEIVMKNGGETYRAEEMINYICKGLGMENISSYVTPTGLIISVSQPGEPPETIVKRIKERLYNLEKVSLVNDFSRNIIIKKWGHETALQYLHEIDKRKPGVNTSGVIFASALASGVFTLFLGGLLADATASFLASLIIQGAIFLSVIKEVNFFPELMGGFFAGFLSIILVKNGLGQNLDLIVIGAIIPLVPGIPLTNGIRDAIKGELVSGMVRTFEAFWISVAIAAGVAASFYLLGQGV